MTLELHPTTGGFEALAAEWNQLLQSSASNTIFLTPEWQRAWWDSFGQGRDLHLLAARSPEGQLRSIVPLFGQEVWLDPEASLPDIRIESADIDPAGAQQRAMHLVGGSEVSDYLDIIASGEDNLQACAALLDYLEERKDWQFLDLRSIPSTSPTIASITGQAASRGWQVTAAPEDVCPVLELPSSWDEYLATCLDKKRRHELRRKMRKAERETEMRWYLVEVQDLAQGLEVFLTLHRASDPEKSEFMTARMEGFFRRVAREALARNWLRLAVLEFDALPVASYLCFDYRGERLVYNSGFDVSTYRQLSPGIVLLGYLIEDAILSGCRRFDFLQGNERYKYDLGAHDTEVKRVFVRR